MRKLQQIETFLTECLSLKKIKILKDEENFGGEKTLQMSSYLGQCATSTVSTAQLEPSLHNF